MIKKIALIGNPNVGKSTIFNTLTKNNVHTGNWPGKTVGCSFGRYTYKSNEYMIYDLPGTYSLVSHSKEEDIAKEFPAEMAKGAEKYFKVNSYISLTDNNLLLLEQKVA